MVSARLALSATLAACALIASAQPAHAEPETLPFVARMVPPPGYEPSSHPRYGWLVTGAALFGLGYYGHAKSDDPSAVRFAPIAGPLIDRYWGFAALQVLGAGLGSWAILSPHREFVRTGEARGHETQRALLQLSPGPGSIALSGEF